MKIHYLGIRKMNNITLNSICVKISTLLAIDNKYMYTISDLLYHLAISDFCKTDGSFNSNNIRNINSILYYSKILNAALLKMQLFNLIIVEGETVRSSSISENFVSYYAKAAALNELKKRMDETHQLCLKSRNIIQTYSTLYNKYVKNKIEGEN